MTRQREVQQAAPITGNPQEDLVNRVQQRVEEWVAAGYPGASEVTRILLRHWFGDPHLLADDSLFQWYPHQRRAVETAIYLYEVERARRVEDYARVASLSRVAQRDPWAKLGLQLATGAGKTKVLSLLMTWAHLHWALDDDEDLGFGGMQLLIAPNLIVLERLLSDFANGAIFERDPLVPPDLRRSWDLQVVTADDVPSEWRQGKGYLVVTNIQKLFANGNGDNVDEDLPAQLAMFERATPTQLDLGVPRLLDFLGKATTPIAVYNDEAHHVHDEATHYIQRDRAKLDADAKEGVAWHGVLSRLDAGPGLALQADVSATLYEETSKAWFRHTVYNYPLAQAIADGVVKQPYLAKVELRAKGDGDLMPPPLVDESATHAWDRYTQLIQAGIAEWKKEQEALDKAGINRKAIMFIVCNNKSEAREIAERLREFADPETNDVPFAGKVAEIHIGVKEANNQKEWERIRAELKRIDEPDNPYTAVVSVMMLKEGWDVRNVKVIVPLRPCDSRTLTEQLLGRGLRRMFPPQWSPEGELRDQGVHEGLYVIRHPSFAAIINQISDIVTETDSRQTKHDPTRVVVNPVEPEEERERRDLPIPTITGAYETTDDWVDKINRQAMPPLPQRFPWISSIADVEGVLRHSGVGGARFKEDEVRYNVQLNSYASVDAVMAAYAESIRNEQRLSRYYEAQIKALVKAYLERCVFSLPPGVVMNLDDAAASDDETRRIVLANIQAPPVKDATISQVVRIIGAARSGEVNPEIQVAVRRAMDLPAFEAVPRITLPDPEKCVFDRCCFDSPDEQRLAGLLDEADDVAAWLWNDQTGVGFRMQYAFEGRTPFYYPDFVARLTDGSMWVVESKGSIRERDRAKEARAERYVDQLTIATKTPWRYLFLVNDTSLNRGDVAWWAKQGRRRFSDLVRYVDNLPPLGQR